MTLPEMVSDPIPLAVLTLVIVGVVHYQRGLTWTEYTQIHRAKVRLFPILSRFTDVVSFVNQKGGRGDGEYIGVREQSVKAVFKQLVAEGGSPHLICSIKKRPENQYSDAHVVWIQENAQVECYLFGNGDGTTDLYVHSETAVTDPEGHLSDRQTDGDPTGVVTDALGLA